MNTRLGDMLFKIILSIFGIYIIVLFSYYIDYVSEKYWWFAAVTALLCLSIIYSFLLKKEMSFSIFVFKYNDSFQSTFFRCVYFTLSIIILLVMPVVLSEVLNTQEIGV